MVWRILRWIVTDGLAMAGTIAFATACILCELRRLDEAKMGLYVCAGCFAADWLLTIVIGAVRWIRSKLA